MKQGIKRANSKSRGKRVKETMGWSNNAKDGSQSGIIGTRIGNTYDNRRRFVIKDHSFNDFSISGTISPEESVIIPKSMLKILLFYRHFI